MPLAVGVDLSWRQLQHARRIDEETSIPVPTVCGTALALPFADASFDLVASAFGALPFVVDIAAALREVRRVLVPGGRAAFSVVHPVRRMFPTTRPRRDDDHPVLLRPGGVRRVERTTGSRRTSNPITPSATGSARSSRRTRP